MNYEDLNKQQKESEIDTFTLERYRQFARHITRRNIKILDVGCNTGRGGKILKEMITSSSIVGVDIVESRLQKVEPDVYDELMYLSIMEINSSYNDTFDYVVAGEVVVHDMAEARIDHALLMQSHRDPLRHAPDQLRASRLWVDDTPNVEDAE